MKDVLLQGLDLSASERLALTQLLERLKRDHSRTILLVVLYGSIARDERGPDSDVDLLIITRHDDWREHEPIRFLAARLSNEYDVFLSVRVMSLAHLNKLRNLQPLLYQNICQDGIELLRIGDGPGLVKRQPLPASSSSA
jgi:predicted nucleotidyltransferase